MPIFGTRGRVRTRIAGTFRRRVRHTTGATMIELAIVLPAVLAPLCFGTIEYGFLRQKVHAVEAATRAGGRAMATSCVDGISGCRVGDSKWDDENGLRAVKGALGSYLNDVEYVVI